MRTDTSVASAAMISLGDLERQLKEALRPVSAPSGVDILRSDHFVSLVRGHTSARNIGTRRECRIEILVKNERGVDVAAVYGSRGLGWLDTLEFVLVHVGNRSLMWKRKGKDAEVSINGQNVARIELGWSLAHMHVGSGKVWFEDVPFCDIALPLRGPSSPQKSDCTGSFTFGNDRKPMKFLINPQEAESSNENAQAAKSRVHATIFDPADEARLVVLSNDQRLLLLTLALWPWSIYKAEKKAP